MKNGHKFKNGDLVNMTEVIRPRNLRVDGHGSILVGNTLSNVYLVTAIRGKYDNHSPFVETSRIVFEKDLEKVDEKKI